MTEAPPRLLATTALERTWGATEPIAFLGEWCRRYDRRAAWEGRRHEMLPYHWDDREKNRRDHAYLKGLHDALLKDLARALGACHGLGRPVRYWQALLDPWLLTYVPVLWDRWEALRLAFEGGGRFDTVVLGGELAPAFDYKDFVEKALNDPWNHRLYADIIKSRYGGRCRVLEAPAGSEGSGGLLALSSSRPRSLGGRVAAAIDRGVGKMSGRREVVFFESYFPRRALAKLSLRLGQWPRLSDVDEFAWPVPLAERNVRAGLRLSLAPKGDFEAYLLGRILRDLPAAYVEGFAALRALALAHNPAAKVILTANAHWHNERFKVWSAERVHAGAKLVALQHGGSIPLEFHLMDFEEDVADVKAVWTLPFHPKHRRLPANKLVTAGIDSSREFLGVVGLEVPRYSFRIEAAPTAGQVLATFRQTCELHDALSPGVRCAYRVKPFPDIGWGTRQRYLDRLGAEKVSGERSYVRFLGRCRIVVCTYPQTTFAEAMASGLPTVLLYEPRLWDLLPPLGPLMRQLESAKIVFGDPAKAAAHLDAVWARPQDWWEDAACLGARREFHRQAVDLDGDWLEQWSGLIQQLLELSAHR